ncbi:MAG: molybdate ABC transporter substrate-binding protein [Chloroflexus sp.]|nr:molybdate ABC transporter substrate-binding protein [Chloroflexus sp.]
MLRSMSLLLLVLWVVTACSAPQATVAPEITVAAAADLSPAFQEIGALFTERTGIRVVFNFGSTGQLAQQIERGAPFDVFFAANQSFVEDLAAKGVVDASSMTIYAQGRITVWTRADQALKPQQLTDLLDPAYRRIAIANPEHAPYGQAAREALERAGIWEQIKDRLVFGENVAQTLTLADTGNVEAAIVALSLSVSSNGWWVLIPAELHPDHPLIQMAAIVASSQQREAAQRFMEFVTSPKGHEIMKKHGFILPDEMIESAR